MADFKFSHTDNNKPNAFGMFCTATGTYSMIENIYTTGFDQDVKTSKAFRK